MENVNTIRDVCYCKTLIYLTIIIIERANDDLNLTPHYGDACEVFFTSSITVINAQCTHLIIPVSFRNYSN